jgi:hypothetical protein
VFVAAVLQLALKAVVKNVWDFGAGPSSRSLHLDEEPITE